MIHPQGNHKMKDCYKLDSLTEVLAGAKGNNKKPDNQGRGFQKASREVNYIFGGSEAYEGKRKQKLTYREVMLAAPSTPEYLPWSEVPILFSQRDHLDHVPKLGRCPLLVTPTIRDVDLSRVLVHGGS